MSTFEKVIGLVGVFLIIIVFLILTIIIVQFLLSWSEKGINPMKKFPCNSKGRSLSTEEQRALNIGAILSEVNSDFWNTLETTNKVGVRKNMAKVLKRDWEIESTEDAMQILEELKKYGHRKIFSLILKNITEVLSPAYSCNTFKNVYEQVGLSLLDEEILENYPNHIKLVDNNIDVFFNVSSYKELEKFKELFGDDKTFDECVQIYIMLSQKYNRYICSINNLRETFQELQNYGVIKDVSELAELDVSAWDMGRMVNVSRYSYDCGYLSEEQAWEYIFLAEKKSVLCYSDWASFGKAYIVGRAIWGGWNINLSATIKTVEELQKNAKSPWMLAKLK